MSDTLHIQEIHQVIEGQVSERDSTVQQSWRRCMLQYNMDPTRAKSAYIVPETKLYQHRQQSEQLIRIARSGLENLYRQVAGQNYVLLLADASGITIDFFGDQIFENRLRKSGLHLGSDWSEQQAGTCGVGSCIATGEAITIHQTDHFDLTHVALSCTAAPIFSTNGELIAVLDISLLRSPEAKVSQSLAMQLVKNSANQIEMANLMALNRSEWILRFSQLPEFLDVNPDAAIALDAAGNIQGMTHIAARMLSRVVNLNWRQNHEIIGKPLAQFFDLTLDDLPKFSRARPTEQRIVFLKDGTSLFCHAISPHQTVISIQDKSSKLPRSLYQLSGEDPTMRKLAKNAAKLINSKMAIMITGETGAGKKTFAEAIHNSKKDNSHFLALNASSLTPERLHQQLNSVWQQLSAEDKQQALIDASYSTATLSLTLFLQNIDKISEQIQAELIELLDNGMTTTPITPITSAAHIDSVDDQPTTLKLKCSIISSTSQDLGKLMRDKRIRPDLFFRLNGATLQLPPLRSRQDFDWLLNKLLRQLSIPHGKSFTLSSAAKMELRHQQWLGNVRELAHTLETTLALSPSTTIDLEDLPRPIFTSETKPFIRHDTIADEAADLEKTLTTCHWNVARAARLLNIDRTTLHRRMRKLGVERPA